MRLVLTWHVQYGVESRRRFPLADKFSISRENMERDSKWLCTPFDNNMHQIRMWKTFLIFIFSRKVHDLCIDYRIQEISIIRMCWKKKIVSYEKLISMASTNFYKLKNFIYSNFPFFAHFDASQFLFYSF